MRGWPTGATHNHWEKFNVRTWKPMSLLLVGAFALAACTSDPGTSTEPSTPPESMAPESMAPESMAP